MATLQPAFENDFNSFSFSELQLRQCGQLLLYVSPRASHEKILNTLFRLGTLTHFSQHVQRQRLERLADLLKCTSQRYDHHNDLWTEFREEIQSTCDSILRDDPYHHASLAILAPMIDSPEAFEVLTRPYIAALEINYEQPQVVIELFQVLVCLFEQQEQRCCYCTYPEQMISNVMSIYHSMIFSTISSQDRS